MAKFNWRSQEDRREAYQVIAIVIAATMLSHAIGWWPYGVPAPKGPPMNSDTIWRIIYLAALLGTGILYYLGRRVRPQSASEAPIPIRPRSITASADSVTEHPALSQGYSIELAIHGPSDIDFVVFRDGAGCRCKFKNGSLYLIEHCQIQFQSAQSLDFAKGRWRGAIESVARIASNKWQAGAGAYSSDFQFMTTDSEGSLRIGLNPVQVFPWPNADPSTIRRWRIKFSISGSFPDKTEWNADICLRWAFGSPVEIREYSDATPVADF